MRPPGAQRRRSCATEKNESSVLDALAAVIAVVRPHSADAETPGEEDRGRMDTGTVFRQTYT